MKKTLLSICLSGLLIGSIEGQATKVTKFTKTVKKEIIKSYRSGSQMKGKPLVEIYTSFDTPYTVYMSHLGSIEIKLPYQPLKPFNSANNLVNHKIGNKTVVLWLKKDYVGRGPNIHIPMENGQRLFLNVEILPPNQYDDANQIVTFVDIDNLLDKQQKESIGYFKVKVEQQKMEIAHTKQLLKQFLDNPIKKVALNEEVRLNQGKTIATLKSVALVGTTFVCHMSVHGEPIPLTKENVLLDISNYDESVFNTLFDVKKTDAKQSEHPFKIDHYKDSQDVSLYFQLAEVSDLFVFKLTIWPHIVFNNHGKQTIDFMQSNMDKSLFEEF